MSAPTEALQSYCTLVEDTFGQNAPELMPYFAEDGAAVADTAEALQARFGLEDGTAAEKAMASLGCGACQLSGVCTVRENLETRRDIGKENAELTSNLAMLGTAPRWLTAARLQNSDLTIEDVKRYASDPETTQAAMASGELDIESLLGGVANQPLKPRNKSSVPALRALASFPEDATAPSTLITTETGDNFVVIDASDALTSRPESPPEKDYGILMSKLLNRMSERGADGQPQILHPDNTMQKVIGKLGGQSLQEFRKSGKSRAVCTVATPESGAEQTEDYPVTATITILGSHGGDEATQQQFLNSLKG
jgi:hypothetical protein